MRDDFAKLLVLTGRRGGGETFRIHRAAAKQRDFENAPSKQGMRRPYRERKEFNEYLNPLKRFLYKQVNRPWDVVYSELMQSLHGGNTIIQHVKQHLFSYVELDVFYVGNVPYHKPPFYGWGQRVQIAEGSLYVDNHGVIRKARKQKSQYRNTNGNLRVVINPFEEYIKVNGMWFHVWFKEYSTYAHNYQVGYSIEDAFFGSMTVVAVTKQWNNWEGPAAGKLFNYGPVPSGERAGSSRYAYKKCQVGKREIQEEKLNG